MYRRDLEDIVINKSYKYIDLISKDSSLVIFFSLEL